MKQVFKNILDFTKIRTHCLFCNSKLVAELSNFSGTINKDIPLYSGQLDENNIFNFKLVYHSIYSSVNTVGHLNAETNNITFDEYQYTSDLFGVNIELDVFQELHPYIILNCENNKCKMSYYAATDILKHELLSIEGAHINPVVFNWESFNYKKFWIQNDWVNMKTNIYSIMKPNVDPISYPLIDFRDYENDKLINRIKTLIVFN